MAVAIVAVESVRSKQRLSRLTSAVRIPSRASNLRFQSNPPEKPPIFPARPARDGTEPKPESDSRRTRRRRRGRPWVCQSPARFRRSFSFCRRKFSAARSRRFSEIPFPAKSSGGRVFGGASGENFFQRGFGRAMPVADFGRDDAVVATSVGSGRSSETRYRGSDHHLYGKSSSASLFRNSAR